MQDRDLARGTGFLAAGLGPILVAGVLAPLAQRPIVPSLAAVALAAVVVVAARGGAGPALGAATMSGLTIDFFFTSPYRELKLHSASVSAAAAFALLAVGAAAVFRQRFRPARTGRRAGPARRNRSRHIERIVRLIGDGVDPDDLVVLVGAELESLLLLRGWRYEPGERSALPARIGRDGRVAGAEPGGGGDDADHLPSGLLELPVRAGDRAVGRFVLEANPAASVPRRHRLVAVILTDHLAAALAIEPAAHSTPRREAT